MYICEGKKDEWLVLSKEAKKEKRGLLFDILKAEQAERMGHPAIITKKRGGEYFFIW